jgi:hypothetical protein
VHDSVSTHGTLTSHSQSAESFSATEEPLCAIMATPPHRQMPLRTFCMRIAQNVHPAVPITNAHMQLYQHHRRHATLRLCTRLPKPKPTLVVEGQSRTSFHIIQAKPQHASRRRRISLHASFRAWALLTTIGHRCQQPSLVARKDIPPAPPVCEERCPRKGGLQSMLGPLAWSSGCSPRSILCTTKGHESDGSIPPTLLAADTATA